MAEVGPYTPYSTARPLMPALDTWVSEYDAMRIASYMLYERIYWNVPETFELSRRGSSSLPIYVPNGRVICDAANRYTAAGFGYAADPAFGSESEQATAAAAFKFLFDRERFLSKFHSNKLFGIIRGDWAFHVVADPNRPEGKRISIYNVDPASLFLIPHPDDVERIMGVHLIETVEQDDKTYIKRQTYSKGPDPYDPDADDGRIYSGLSVVEMEGWDTPNAVRLEEIVPHEALPDLITAIPVYQIRNQEEPNNPWGSSELRGMERIISAVNQAISDEELALALEGLGLYATNSGPPTDEDGEESDWILGPGRVVEVEGNKDEVFFDRVDGVGSVKPYIDHLKFLTDSIREGSATPVIATGQVDVKVAESGVALALQMSPILSKCDLKDISIRDTSVQMFYDLKFWLQEYEGINTGEALVAPVFGPKLPVNVEKEVERVVKIVEAGLASPDWGRVELAKYGYQFAADEGDKVIAAQAATAAAADPFAARVDEEMG